jgi:hypothetical protein
VPSSGACLAQNATAWVVSDTHTWCIYKYMYHISTSKKYMCMYVCMHVCMYACMCVWLPEETPFKKSMNIPWFSQ